jgi:ribosomal protein L18
VKIGKRKNMARKHLKLGNNFAYLSVNTSRNNTFCIFESQHQTMAVSQKELDFNNNDDKMRLKISALEQELAKIYLGGGKARIEKQHQQGKLTARERIDLLLDMECTKNTVDVHRVVLSL